MSEPYIGEIRMFAGSFAPYGWALCDGELLPISQYDALFGLIGTTYGGDGQTTFGLPDLRSRIPVHTDSGSGYPLSAAGGVETVTLLPQQLPVHSHAPAAASGAATSASSSGAVWAGVARAAYSTATPDTTMSAQALTRMGAGQPHDNMPPFLVLNFIIALQGIFPSPT